MGPADTEAQAFRATAQKAKRAYWRGLVQSATSYPEIYRVVQWHKHQPRYLSPPLRAPDGTHATDPAAKSHLLQESLLHRAQMDKDIPYDTPAVPARAVPWAPIQEAEAYAATCQVSSTTPGIDEIPVQAIQKAWKLLGPRITHLYQACLRQGVHPLTFKDARVVVLPKAGNRDWALPASYRPIALLSCLGKGLERLMARRLAFWAKELKILAPDQCGAISQRSATDLTMALLSDINDQWAQHRVAGMVTIDAQGAFDGVLGGRLIYRLREQGWPKEVLDWVHSFLSNRTARINLDNTTSEPFRTYGGLPQGSPVSPILFLLYIEPLLRLGKSRFGYADDACLLGSGKDLPTCGQALQKSLNGALQWGADNGIQFEISKTELQYFHRKRQGRRQGPIIEPPLQAGQTTIHPNDTTRWLGLYFDRQLSFKSHIQRAVVRARRVIEHVRKICRTTFGANAALLRQAVQACAIGTLLYGVETWYNARTTKGIISQVQTAINRAAQTILPAHRTTPTAALLREVGWAPAEAWLKKAHDRQSIRAAAAGPSHPLSTRWQRPTIQWIRQRQSIQTATTPVRPPWDLLDRKTARAAVGAIGKGAGPEGFCSWLAARPPLDFTVYSDGSLLNDRAGGAFCIFRGESLLGQGQIGLGELATVYDAEVLAATAGLQAALDHYMTRFATNIAICLDNEEAAIRLHDNRPTETSANAFAHFERLRHEWATRERAGCARPGVVEIRWVPGHRNIPGNELADRLAKAACSLPPDNKEATLAAARRLLKDRYISALKSHWDTNAPRRYQDLEIPAQGSPPLQELRIPRAALGALLAARSGHGDFANYHERFAHADAELHCTCGARKTPEHFFFCPRGRARARIRAPGPHKPHTTIQWILGTPEGATYFGRWCLTSGFFEKICPRWRGRRDGL